jgi:hypothetical protein
MKKVTVKMLDKYNACEEDVSLFILYFGKEAEVTLENCMICAELGLDIDWFASRVLPEPAWAEYRKAMAPAWAEYNKTIKQAWAEHRKAIKQAWAERRKAMAPALYYTLTI